MAKGLKITIDDKKLNRQIEKAMKVNPKETVKAVRDCTLDLAANSAKRAPIESGDLRNNCHANVNGIPTFAKQSSIGSIVPPSTKVHGEVGYSLPYALRQHEDLSYSHIKTDGYKRSDGTTVNMIAGGEAKFLEKPFKEKLSQYISRFRKIVERSLK